jgi:dTDP-4-dehydrorhamnose reductase
MMGVDVIPVLSKKHEVIPSTRMDMDVSDSGSIKKAIEIMKPDYILHLAALTDLDYCEQNPDIAMRVNGEMTGVLAEYCSKFGIKLIYMSTSGVFSGFKSVPYDESIEPKPVSTYGKSKYLGEKLVKSIMNSSDFLILRAGWVFGGGEKDKKFVGKIFRLMKSMDSVKVVSDIFGSPAYTCDIGELVNFLIEKEASGIYHSVNEGIASRYEIAVKIKEFSGVKTEIIRASSEDFPTVAPRPPMEGIVNKNLEDVYGYKMRYWQDALRDYIGVLKGVYNG